MDVFNEMTNSFGHICTTSASAFVCVSVCIEEVINIAGKNSIKVLIVMQIEKY